MKKNLEVKPFANIDDVKEKMRKVLLGITTDEFKKCFEHRNKRLDKHISCDGEHFESD